MKTIAYYTCVLCGNLLEALKLIMQIIDDWYAQPPLALSSTANWIRNVHATIIYIQPQEQFW